MKNLLAIPCLMVLLAACGGTSTVEETTGADINTVQSAETIPFDKVECGFGCGGGFAPTGYGCYGGCGTCPSTGDQYTAATGTNCTSTLHGTYRACGLGAHLASGHYNAGYVIDRYCDAVYSSNLGTVPNKTEYRTLPGADTSFSTCGIGCPSGYSVTGYAASSGCSTTGTTPTQKNITHCRNLVSKSWSWTICGTDSEGCPSGFSVGSRSHTTSCEKPGDSLTGNNAITCTPIP